MCVIGELQEHIFPPCLWRLSRLMVGGWRAVNLGGSHQLGCRPPLHDEPVLRGYILKADRFHDIHAAHRLGEPTVDGTWNFRRCGRDIPIYGMGQSSMRGIESTLLHLNSHFPGRSITCINMREELVCFLDDEPCNIRDPRNPFDNIESLQGVGSDTVEMMEEKLRFEILALLEERGEFEVSLESSDFGLLKEALKLKSVMTPHGVYAGLAAKQGLQARDLALSGWPFLRSTTIEYLLRMSKRRHWRSLIACSMSCSSPPTP
eukprot:scaffold3910_cov537-Prasinococcus_capsulatus_cf.AAC.4